MYHFMERIKVKIASLFLKLCNVDCVKFINIDVQLCFEKCCRTLSLSLCDIVLVCGIPIRSRHIVHVTVERVG